MRHELRWGRAGRAKCAESHERRLVGQFRPSLTRAVAEQYAFDAGHRFLHALDAVTVHRLA
jgi:hypothetical protein